MLLILIFALLLVLGYQFHFVHTFRHLGGDSGIGQAYATFTLAALVGVIMFLYFIVVCYKSNFQWLSEKMGMRFLILSTFCISLLLTLFFTYYFAIEWHGEKLPYFLKLVANSSGYFWIAICVIIPFYFLANSTSQPVAWIQHLIRFDIAVCYIYTLGLGYGFLNENNLLPSIGNTEKPEQIDQYQLNLLQEIKNYPADQHISGLMSSSNVMRPKVIYEAALTKIKQRPDWENEILELLRDRVSYQHSFEFLSGNPVDHPELFKEAMLKSISFLEQDAILRIRDEMQLRESTLDFINIEAMLRSIETQFNGQTAYFVPSVEQLRQAIYKNTPSDQKKVKLNALKGIERWLDSQRK